MYEILSSLTDAALDSCLSLTVTSQITDLSLILAVIVVLPAFKAFIFSSLSTLATDSLLEKYCTGTLLFVFIFILLLWLASKFNELAEIFNSNLLIVTGRVRSEAFPYLSVIFIFALYAPANE